MEIKHYASSPESFLFAGLNVIPCWHSRGGLSPYSKEEALRIVEALGLHDSVYHHDGSVGYLSFSSSDVLDEAIAAEIKFLGEPNYIGSVLSYDIVEGYSLLLDDPSKTFWGGDLILNPHWDFTTGDNYCLEVIYFPL
jgi:hypothetical protein